MTAVSRADRAPGRAEAGHRRGGLRRRSRWVAILFLLPALAINLLVIGGPTVASIYYAFTDWNGLSRAGFVGLDNFVELASDGRFWNALGHNFIYLAIFMTVPFAMGLAGAFMLSRIRRGATLFRVLFFIPYIVVSVVNAQIWKNLLNPEVGIAAQLRVFDIHVLDDVYFFGDRAYTLASVAFVDNWHFWGFLVVLFLAAMQGIDNSLYEAARVDGANARQEFRHIVLPGIRPTLVFALTLIALASLLAFDYAYILTGGGPARSSDLVALLINRTAIQSREAGYGSAMAISLTLLSAVLLALFAWLRRNEDET